VQLAQAAEQQDSPSHGVAHHPSLACTGTRQWHSHSGNAGFPLCSFPFPQFKSYQCCQLYM